MTILNFFSFFTKAYQNSLLIRLEITAPASPVPTLTKVKLPASIWNKQKRYAVEAKGQNIELYIGGKGVEHRGNQRK
jgi:hypothetical protein